MFSRRTFLQGAVAGLATAGYATAFAAENSVPQKAGATEKTPLNVFLFEGFETIDAMGPVEMLAYAGIYDIRFYGLTAGIVKRAFPSPSNPSKRRIPKDFFSFRARRPNG